MTEQELKSLIAEGETSMIEFKSWILTPDYKDIKALVIKSAVALANAKGGLCLLGVENDGTITGCNTKFSCQNIMDAIYEGTRPSLFTDIYPVATSEGTVYVVTVDKVTNYVATTTGIYYRRLGNTSKPFFPGSGTYSPMESNDFSARFVEGASESDIDLIEVYKLKEKLRQRDSGSTLPDMDDIGFLENLELIRKSAEGIRITVGGMLFVGKQRSIKQYLPQAEVIYLHYSSNDQLEYDNRLDMISPIISVLDTLAERIKAHNHLVNIQVGLFRLEIYDFADAVFQEALLNAITHRSYESLAPIYVKHYPDKIVIENPGGFPEDITISNIITHQSTPRNKLIAMTLQRLKYVQRSGQGVDIMYRNMLVDGKPYPEYQVAPESIRLTLHGSMENEGFVRFIAEEQDKNNRLFSLQKLMLLRYLYEHKRIKLDNAAELIQEPKESAQKELEELRALRLIEPSGREYMLTAKVYEAVKNDVAYIQDKMVTHIVAKSRILEYLAQKEFISSVKVQELCGYNKDQAYRILTKLCEDGMLHKVGKGRGTKYLLMR